MTAHAKLSPSAASRWMRCTMAPTLEAGLPDESSPYAQEGTQAHELAEFCARTSVGLSWAGAPPKAADQEMQDAADEYAAFVKETFLGLRDDGADPHIETEMRLDLTDWIPEGFGTADCLIVADGTLHVIDFKYGKGVKVDADHNRQMMIYALGALHWAQMLYDIEAVRMVIVQPRLGGISEWGQTAEDLLAWGEDELRPAARAAFDGSGVYCPGEDTCRFCRAAGSCRAQAEHFVKLFDDVPDPGLLSIEETADLLKKAAGMSEWLKSIEGTVFSALMDGGTVPGWKLVEGRSTRRYTDEEEIAKRLRKAKYKVSEIYEKKLLGISKMEKLLGKKQMGDLIGDLIEKPRGAAKLAPESDKRPAYDPEEQIMEAFDD